MAAPIQYNDANLQRLFAEMDVKHRLKALKGAFRREANRVRKTALNNLHGSIGGDSELDRGVRAIVFKRKAGFRVTIGTKAANKNGKGERGYYISRRRRNKPGATGKPVLIWAEAGTKWRKSKKATRYLVGGEWRIGRTRGFMKRYGFMQKTLMEVRGSVTENLHQELRTSIIKVAKKYGCT